MDDGVYLLAGLYLRADLQDAVLKGCLAIENKAVGIGYLELLLLPDTCIGEYGGVDTSILYGVVGSDDERRHVLRETASALDHGATPYPDARVGDDVGGEDGIIVYLHRTGYLGTVADDSIVEDVGIMADMDSLHNAVAATDDGAVAAEGGAVDDHVLADNVVIADGEGCLVAGVAEVLRHGAEHCALMDGVVGAEGGAGHDAYVGIDDTVVAYHGVSLYVCKGIDGNIIAYLG